MTKFAIPTENELADLIERTAAARGVPISTLTRDLCNDASLVLSLRRGRSPQLSHVRKILDGLGVPHAAV